MTDPPTANGARWVGGAELQITLIASEALGPDAYRRAPARRAYCREALRRHREAVDLCAARRKEREQRVRDVQAGLRPAMDVTTACAVHNDKTSGELRAKRKRTRTT
jgi:hypothetical protein